MVGLIDIVPLVERVTVRGHEVEVRCIDLTTLGLMAWQFPEFRRMWETRNFGAEEILMLSGPMIARLIAAACPDTITEESARNLSPGEQAEIVGKIFKVTFGDKGLRPFGELMATLMGTINQPAAAPSVLALVTNSGSSPRSSSHTGTATQ